MKVLLIMTNRLPPLGVRFVAVSAGGSHTCGIREDGTVACWGDNASGGSTPPSGVRFVAVSAGESHTCGIREDGTVACWGDNFNDKATPPSGVRFSVLSAGQNHTCGIREDTGEGACWGLGSDPGTDEGSFDYDQSTPPSGVRFLALSAGGGHTCGIREDGETECWGLGSNPDVVEDPPTAVGPSRDYDQSTPPEGVRFLALSAGTLHTCGIREDTGRSVMLGFGFGS